jgi:hypothetical protein
MLSFMSNESNPVRDQYPSMSWENRGLTREGRPSSGLGPKPPPMQVVTKGWWVLREREASAAELYREDREIEERAAKRRKR